MGTGVGSCAGVGPGVPGSARFSATTTSMSLGSGAALGWRRHQSSPPTPTSAESTPPTATDVAIPNADAIAPVSGPPMGVEPVARR